MKTTFKIVFWMNMVGWIPLILTGGIKATIGSVLGIMLVGSLCLLFISLFLFMMLMADSTFWKTHKELLEKKAEHQEAINKNNEELHKHVMASIKLANKVMELDKKKEL